MMEEVCQCHTVPSSPEEEWIEGEVGECKVVVGELTEPIMDYDGYVSVAELEKVGIYAQVLLGSEFTLEDAHEIALMVGRVMRAFYVRTRLLPLLDVQDTGRYN